MLEVSIRSRNGAPSRKGCVVNGQTTKANDQRKQQMSTPPGPGSGEYTRRNGMFKEGEIRKIDECDMEKSGTVHYLVDSSEKTIAILGDTRG